MRFLELFHGQTNWIRHENSLLSQIERASHSRPSYASTRPAIDCRLCSVPFFRFATIDLFEEHLLMHRSHFATSQSTWCAPSRFAHHVAEQIYTTALALGRPCPHTKASSIRPCSRTLPMTDSDPDVFGPSGNVRPRHECRAPLDRDAPGLRRLVQRVDESGSTSEFIFIQITPACSRHAGLLAPSRCARAFACAAQSRRHRHLARCRSLGIAGDVIEHPRRSPSDDRVGGKIERSV